MRVAPSLKSVGFWRQKIHIFHKVILLAGETLRHTPATQQRHSVALGLDQLIMRFLAVLRNALTLLLLPAAAVFGQPAGRQQILLVPDGVATATELVTLGIPFPPGALRDPQTIRIFDDHATEKARFAKCIQTWHWKDGSCAQVKVQFAFDASGGNKTYTFDYGTTNASTTRSEQAVATALQPSRNGQSAYRVFAILSPDWLVSSEVANRQLARLDGFVQSDMTYVAAHPTDDGIPPDYRCVQAHADNVDRHLCDWDQYFDIPFNYGSQPVKTWSWDADTTAILNDLMSVLWLQYIRTGDWHVYKEAMSVTRYYYQSFCSGGRWNKATSGQDCDGKYTYLKPFWLYRGVSGDDELVPRDRTTAAAITIDQIAQTNFPTQGGGDFYVNSTWAPDRVFTERAAGTTLAVQVYGYMLTGNTTYLQNANRWIAGARALQLNPGDGFAKDGCWRHSWSQHEGGTYPGLIAADRACSTWMTNEYLIPALWDSTQILGSAELDVAKAMIKDYGGYMLTYAFTQSSGYTQYNHYTNVVYGEAYITCNRPAMNADGTGAPDGSVFERSSANGPIKYLTFSDVLWTPYVSSSTTSLPNLSDALNAETDLHTPSAALPLAWAWSVEQDNTKKTALADYLNRVIGMFHSNKEGPSGYAARCGTTSGSYGNPARREFNWQRAGGVSWAWIMRNPDLTGNSGPRPLPPTNLTVH